MLAPIVCLLGILGLVDGPEIGADQFARLMIGQFEAIRDVQMIYEGNFEYVGPADLPARFPKDSSDQFAQSFYAFRSDGATLMEVYSDRKAMGTTHREVSSMLRWKQELTGLYANSKNEITRPIQAAGHPGAFFHSGTPERLLYCWYFSFWPGRWLADPAVTRYRFLGWEMIDSHRCLNVERSALINAPDGPFFRFWLDLERGGHPLKVEMWDGASKLATRVDRIELAQFPEGHADAMIWLPISGIEQSFRWDDRFYEIPIFRATYSIVHGSVRLNQGLKDEDFSLRSPLLSKPAERPSLKAKYDRTPNQPTDRQSVQRGLDEALAKANRQAEELVASMPVEINSGWNPALQITFLMIGIALLCGSLVWRIKAR